MRYLLCRGRVCVVGRAAIALRLDRRWRARRVSEVIEGGEFEAPEMRKAARRVARDRSCDEGWLNERAVWPAPHRGESAVYEDGDLRVTAASPVRVLAMKLRRARAADREDIGFLVGHLGLRSAREALDIHDR